MELPLLSISHSSAGPEATKGLFCCCSLSSGNLGVGVYLGLWDAITLCNTRGREVEVRGELLLIQEIVAIVGVALELRVCRCRFLLRVLAIAFTLAGSSAQLVQQELQLPLEEVVVRSNTLERRPKDRLGSLLLRLGADGTDPEQGVQRPVDVRPDLWVRMLNQGHQDAIGPEIGKIGRAHV